ncbi:uncharacterized protein topaz1 isoform X2 [Cheilinus undulatus]|uniref:uncharacterized protein topaz1 isoform X2 n=1 Tax=Cheilinus undulatus TaxID=241271 RepID=UPI001BD512A3|nr:uncharacterized protein topaz1 isoform X2 [Cheilinus undulatus]
MSLGQDWSHVEDASLSRRIMLFPSRKKSRFLNRSQKKTPPWSRTALKQSGLLQQTKDTERHKHPSPAGPTDSEGSSRRVVRASGCRLCGDCKFISPQWNTLGKPRQKSSDPGPEQPKVEFKLGGKNQDPSASKKIIIWIDQYPKVALYDIAQKCAGMRDRKTDQDPRPGHPHTGPGLCMDKRIKLGDTDDNEILPSSPDLESSRNQTMSASRLIEKPHFLESNESRSCLAPSVGSNGTFGPETIRKKPCGEIESPIKTETAEMSEELLSQSGEMDMNEPESFTCQRVKPCPRTLRSSCARTYMSWPLSKSSSTLKAHAGTAAQPAEHIDPLTNDNCASTVNQKQPDLSSKRTDDVIPDLPTDSSTGDTKHQINHLNKKKREDGRCVLVERIHNDEFAPRTAKAEESQASLSSEMATLSSPSQCGPASPSSPVVNGAQTDSSMSTPSPTALGLSNWETPVSCPFLLSGLSRLSSPQSSVPASLFLVDEVKSVESTEAQSAASPLPTCLVKSLEKPLPYCEGNQATSDSLASYDSSFLLNQEAPENDEELPTDRCPPKLEPFYKTSPSNHNLAPPKGRSLHNIPSEDCVENHLDRFPLPPVLSPITSPIWHPLTSSTPQSSGSSDEEEETKNDMEISGGPIEGNMSLRCDNPQTVQTDDLDCGSKETEGASENSKTLTSVRSGPQSSSCNGENVGNDGDEEESQHESDYEMNKTSEQNHSDPELQPTLGSDSPAKSFSASSSDENEGGAFSDEEQLCSSGKDSSSLFKKAGYEEDQIKAEDTHRGVLDEFTAYEQDILLVDVIQDDPELFEILPQSALKLGPSRVTETLKNRPITRVKTSFPRTDGASVHLDKRITPVTINLHCDSPDNTDESSRSWRPQCNTNPASKQSSAWTAKEKQTKALVHFDANNNHVKESFERIQPAKTITSQQNPIPARITTKNGVWNSNQANMAELRRQQTNVYCRQYFSESLSCGYKMCWFLHIPVDGDEKFCIETVIRFTKNPMCLQKAGAVFTGYYENNHPGVYFSMPVLLSLLWALLKAGMVSEVFSVLSVCLTHKIVPGHEFLLGLFNCVREKGLLSLVPELMQLTFKMANAGLLLSLDCLDSVKNTPEFQQTNSHVSGTGPNKVSPSAPFPEYLNLAHSIVEIELCTKQEDWRRMGEVFRSICQSSQRPNQVERISGRITIALLSESKDKLSLPFAAFAETACKNEEGESLNRSFCGRIGISLMLRYYKTHQWAKGRRVVEVLSCSKVNYTTLQGLFGNENGTSRCYLVTVAAELFLQSGSVEGALNTLRENKWFVSSASWPCESSDLESRIRVLQRLAEKSSHRDSLEVLSNLPGLKEPNNLLDISMYTPLFNTHLQMCLERHTLPVASDTVDFMFSKNLAVDQAMLHMLLNKLGKQNLWLRARDLFRHSLRVGYYPGVCAPPGSMFLVVPCRLGELELALTLEMFITVNANSLLHLPENSTSHLSITLKRTQSCESEYLSASNRLASAACIPNPKLDVLYTTVNSAQEQVYTLDISSARAWLRQNHLWANEVWTH